MLKPIDFFNIEYPLFKEIFAGVEYVWDGLKKISTYLQNNIDPNIPGIPEEGLFTKEFIRLDNGSVIQPGVFLADPNIQIGSKTIIESGAYIKGPAIIGSNTEIRQSAYIRGNVIIGDNCVVGHSTEIKNSVMLGNSKAGHFAYIGDSILGAVNLGAGTKLANLKIIDSSVSVLVDGVTHDTGLRKFGAILADGVETGCNSVTAPGTIISKNSILYPNTSARGFIPENTVIKLRQQLELEKKTDG